MRVGIQMIFMLVTEGLGVTDNDKLDWINTDGINTTSGGVRQGKFSEAIANVVNEKILGTATALGQFKLNFE